MSAVTDSAHGHTAIHNCHTRTERPYRTRQLLLKVEQAGLGGFSHAVALHFSCRVRQLLVLLATYSQFMAIKTLPTGRY